MEKLPQGIYTGGIEIRIKCDSYFPVINGLFLRLWRIYSDGVRKRPAFFHRAVFRNWECFRHGEMEKGYEMEKLFVLFVLKRVLFREKRDFGKRGL